MFGQTCLEDGSGDIFPFMENMMQSLLSKEILYPSLKELVDKYPEWLQSKEPTLSLEDLNKYKKQLQLMQKICTEFEAEKDDDTEELKRHRFKLILNFLQEMQKYGQPPEELVGEQPALFQFDNDDNPILSSLSSGAEAPKNCCLMVLKKMYPFYFLNLHILIILMMAKTSRYV
ncbi:peroxisomal biogenesis factor 19-like [Prorops nasuta]|uniref:peroxisomal biogenesis factor 19-like n=1 Tax=Prorops nasuta TaxID=863751 RepID=UPI0034CDC8ED